MKARVTLQIQIEYLCNLGALQGPRTTLFALPLKVPGADGAPARVIAYDSEDRGQVSGIRERRVGF